MGLDVGDWFNSVLGSSGDVHHAHDRDSTTSPAAEFSCESSSGDAVTCSVMSDK